MHPKLSVFASAKHNGVKSFLNLSFTFMITIHFKVWINIFWNRIWLGIQWKNFKNNMAPLCPTFETKIFAKITSSVETVKFPVKNMKVNNSMTSLFAQKVAQLIKWRFMPKNLSQLVIFVIGLAFTWVWGDKNRA